MSDTSTPILILGLSFAAPAPFAEGHVCSASEARVLNSELAENIRNNFARVVKNAKAEGVVTPERLARLRQEFALYSEQYTFGGGRTTRAMTGDPLLRAALEIARPLARQSWQKRGLNPGEDPDRFAEVVAQFAQQPRVLEEAQRRVDALLSVAHDAVSPVDVI